MKQKSKMAVITVCSVLLAAIVALLGVGTAFGWFYNNKLHEDESQFVPFAPALRVYFEQGAGLDAVEVDESELFTVNLVLASDPTYIGKMRIDVTYMGTEPAALKLYLLHFWAQNGAQPSRANALFLSGPNFLANKADSCFYYCKNAAPSLNPRENYILSASDSGITQSVITGYNNTVIYEEDITLMLYARAEAVQANRAEAVWGALPGVAQ